MALPKLNAPVYTLEMPSTGKKHKYRPYTVKEEKALLIARETGSDADTINSAAALLETCIDDLNAKDLTTFDFEFCFLTLRSKSAGEDADVLIECEECSEQTKMKIMLDSLYIDGEILSSEDMTVKITDTIGIEFSYPKFTQTASLSGSSIDIMTKTLARCIKTIYDENGVYHARDYKDSELIDFIESLSSTQFKQIVELFDVTPTVAIDAKYRCGSCEHIGEKTIRGMQNFF